MFERAGLQAALVRCDEAELHHQQQPLTYDLLQELEGMFERLVAALADGDLPAMADAALRFAYYWCAALRCACCGWSCCAMLCHVVIRCAPAVCIPCLARQPGPTCLCSRAAPTLCSQPTFVLPDKPDPIITAQQVQLHAPGPRLRLLRLCVHAGGFPCSGCPSAGHYAQGEHVL